MTEIKRVFFNFLKCTNQIVKVILHFGFHIFMGYSMLLYIPVIISIIFYFCCDLMPVPLAGGIVLDWETRLAIIMDHNARTIDMYKPLLEGIQDVEERLEFFIKLIHITFTWLLFIGTLSIEIFTILAYYVSTTVEGFKKIVNDDIKKIEEEKKKEEKKEEPKKN